MTEAQRREVEAWRAIAAAFNELQSETSIDGLQDVFNEPKVKPLVRAIKFWGEAFHQLRRENGTKT